MEHGRNKIKRGNDNSVGFYQKRFIVSYKFSIKNKMFIVYVSNLGLPSSSLNEQSWLKKTIIVNCVGR